jgi:membrane-bound serine protease (ClpP class)
VQVAGQAVTLQLSDRPVTRLGLSPIQDFLNKITDPSIAAILLTLGTTGLLAELYNPGTYLPGVAGAICLLLAFYALGVLEANWAGLGFVALAFVLFVVDIKAPTHGLLTVAGLACFLLGGFILFNTPELQVPWATLLILAAGTAAFFGFAIAKTVAAHQKRPVTGMEGLIGMVGEVRQPLEPAGMVMVDGELWRAETSNGPVPAGERVTVTGYQGFCLHVRRAA